MELVTVLSPSPRLPYLVLELLLDYLDISTLKVLRLLCKTTKSCIETPEHLLHFRVRITGKDRLDDVLGARDPVPWNRFTFTPTSYYIPRAAIIRFAAAYGDLVLHLELENCRGDNKWQAHENVHCLLRACPNLESLHICNWSFGNVNDYLDTRLLANWKNMRHFHLNIFQTDMDLFPQILSTCSHLETLTLPFFFGEGNGYYERVLVTPLLDMLPRGHLRSVTCKDVRFNGEPLLRLALACVEAGTVLYTNYTVSSSFLKNLAPEHISVLDIIGNLSIVTDTMIRQPLTNLRSIKLTNSDFQIENNAYDLPPFPHLRDVAITFKYSEEVECQKGMELFVDRLAKVRRPTVQNLRMVYTVPQPLIHYVNISPVDLSTSFVNLRVLHVGMWKGGEAEWLKLWPLVAHSLVELELHDCTNLTDRGILGHDLRQPAFLQLKYLRKLLLIRPQYNKLTDLSFVHAFRHMPLRSFNFSALNHRPVRATTLKAMWKGVFGETIQEFYLDDKDMMLEPPSAKPWWRRCWEKVTTRL